VTVPNQMPQMVGFLNVAGTVHDNLDNAFEPANPPLPRPTLRVCRSVFSSTGTAAERQSEQRSGRWLGRDAGTYTYA
jgi:hypothetical protein